ncbi:phospholipase [Legionella adelaidensis]|nr:phospholipase [Legionella adelaidensis]
MSLILLSVNKAATAQDEPQFNNISSNLPFFIKAKPSTILPTEVAIGFPVEAKYQITNPNSLTAVNASIISVPAHTSIQPTGCGSRFTLAPNASCTLTLKISPNGLRVGNIISGEGPSVLMACWNDGISCAGVTNKSDLLRVEVIPPPSLTYQTLLEDKLINADLWGDKPEILSANYGFEGIEGVPGNESGVVAAGGAWMIITTPNAPFSAYTTAQTPSDVAFGFGYATDHADAMPICFSWPVLPSTVNPTDFRLTLNTGQVVRPEVASITPNFLYNKRSCVVIFGQFGNRLAPGTRGAVYPTKVTIVDNGTVLKLVGPNGPVSAVGLSKSSGNPYQPGGGPKLIGAKLSIMNDVGQDAPAAFRSNLPNGGTALYGPDAQFRLRIYTTAGISPDGVAAILPTDFNKYFQIQVVEDNVSTILTDTNIPYMFSAGSITIVGLADLGKYDLPLNDAYIADRDNYLDIILKGDIDAMRLIKAVIIPATGAYSPLYNPGGPGNNPTPGVTYTYPGPAWTQPVTIALDDPQTVNYP